MCWGVQHARQAPIQIPLVRNRVRRALMAFILVRRQEKSLTTRRTALHVLPTHWNHRPARYALRKHHTEVVLCRGQIITPSIERES